MFCREYRILIDFISSTRSNNARYSTTLEFDDKLKHMYGISRKTMESRQWRAATYYNKKIKGSLLVKGNLVFLSLPSNVKHKLIFNWEDPHKISYVSHSVYENDLK